MAFVFRFNLRIMFECMNILFDPKTGQMRTNIVKCFMFMFIVYLLKVIYNFERVRICNNKDGSIKSSLNIIFNFWAF
jgi:hypothetical protein